MIQSRDHLTDISREMLQLSGLGEMINLFIQHAKMDVSEYST